MGKNRRALVPPAPLPVAPSVTPSKRQAEDPSEGQSKRARTDVSIDNASPAAFQQLARVPTSKQAKAKSTAVLQKAASTQAISSARQANSSNRNSSGRNVPMDTDGGNRASSSSSSSSSSQAAPISEAEMIEKLPKRLREPFEFTWEVPALCHYLLKKLSGFKDFTNDKLTAMECELSIFKDVVQDEIESRCEDRLVDIPNDYEKNVLAREMARSMIGWIQKWLKEQEFIDTRENLSRALEICNTLQPSAKAFLDASRASHTAPLTGREETDVTIRRALEKFIDSIQSGSTERSDFPIALMSALPGCGKTRMCLETLHDIVPDVCQGKRSVQHLSLFLTFNSDRETKWDMDECLHHPEHAIAKRLLLSYFGLFLTLPQTDISVQAALDLIRHTEAENRGIAPASLYIFIAMDEATRLLDGVVAPKFAQTGKSSDARFWKQAMFHLQAACHALKTPTWMLVAGTMSHALNDAISTVSGSGSKTFVLKIPLSPLEPKFVSMLLKHIHESKEPNTERVSWSANVCLLAQAAEAAGLPRTLLHAAAPDLYRDTSHLSTLSDSTILRIVGLGVASSPLNSTLLDELETSALLIVRGKETLVHPHVCRIERASDPAASLATSALVFKAIVTALSKFRDLNDSLAKQHTEPWAAWEMFCVIMTNLRILLAVASALTENAQAKFARVDRLFPGTVSSLETPVLFVNVEKWRNYPSLNPARPALCPDGQICRTVAGTTAIDAWGTVYVKSQNRFKPVTLALQCKFPEVETAHSLDQQRAFITAAKQNTSNPATTIVALLTTSHMVSFQQNQVQSNACILPRSGLAEFVAGFKPIAEYCWAYNPNLSTEARIATQFCTSRSTTAVAARAMANAVINARSRVRFESIHELRSFLERRARAYKVNSIPDNSVLSWPFATDSENR